MTERKPGIFRRLFRFIGFLFRMLRALVSLVVVLALLFWLWLIFRAVAPVTIPESGVLIWNPMGDVVERKTLDPFTEALGYWSGEPVMQTRLWDLIQALEKAADDRRIKAMLVNLDAMGYVGPAQVEELQTALRQFATTGKPVWVRAAWLDQSRYALAASAGEIWLDPYGAVEVEGYSVYRNYYREGIDKLGADVEVFRVGDYKSAVEPFLRNDMSAEARDSNLGWLTALWSQYLNAVGTDRTIDPKTLENYASAPQLALRLAGGNAAQAALQQGLVDQLATYEELDAELDQRFAINGEPWAGIEAMQFLNARRVDAVAAKVEKPRNKIAVVTVQGPITLGDPDPAVADAELIADAIHQASDDDNVKALVMRVDSPGGGVYASELIRRAVVAFRETGRPLVVSMGTVAASGGYWISADADSIVADPTTITGSIGVFGLIPTFEDSLKKLGVHSDGVGTTPMAGAFRFDRDLSPALRDLIQQSVEFSYREFIAHVARGRAMTPAEVEGLAGGRVWSGMQALELGLVDLHGGLDIALDHAAELAGLSEGDWRVEHRDALMDPLSQFTANFGAWFAQAKQPSVPEPWQQLMDDWKMLNWMQDRQSVYAWCPCGVSTGR